MAAREDGIDAPAELVEIARGEIERGGAFDHGAGGAWLGRVAPWKRVRPGGRSSGGSGIQCSFP